MKTIYLLLFLAYFLSGCREEQPRAYSVWMAESEMQRFPELWQVDFVEKPKWDYTQGLMATAFLRLAEASGEQRYLEYVKAFADKFVDSVGNVMMYKKEQYSLDRINGGKFLWELWHRTGEKKYALAAERLREQLNDHPRTSEGGFWHKKVYPHQMWLDGLYMGAPFYAQCAVELDRPQDFDDVINQFVIVNRHTYDARTGLNFHGWDESRQQAWADSVTGCSQHVWGRAMGWYFMALTDVLDFIPQDHPRRGEVMGLLQQVAAAVGKAQDEQTGVWYQVMDQPGREGNYLEATASCMFVYAYYKGIRLGYLPEAEYLPVAEKGYEGVVKEFIRENKEEGSISLTRCCAVAGLGGKPYRSGAYDYYIHETIRDNDPKGVGPFILASIEREQRK